MRYANRLSLGVFWGLCLFVGSLGIASTAARGAPGSACRASTARRVARLGSAAESALASGKSREAWRSIRDAVSAARRGGCQKHRSLGRAYLVLGIMEHGNGRWTRMYSAWQRALGLDRMLVLDRRFTNSRLRRAFFRLKKKLYPASARPQPRPRPRLRPQPRLRLRPRPQPPPTDPPPADPPVTTPSEPRVSQPGSTPYDPAARPVVRPAPAPYANTPKSGCRSDNDCKGVRVCDRGRCEYPRRRLGRTPTYAPVRRYPSRRAVPAPPTRKPGYSNKGTVELGLGVGFQWSETSATFEGDTTKMKFVRFSLDLYVGYFIADRFKLGLYLSVPFTKTTETDYNGDPHSSSSWEVDVIIAPGFAFPFSPTVFGFVDFLVGVGSIGGDTGVGDDDNLTMGVVGGEFGLKVALGSHLLMKIGLKPLYLFGKTEVDSYYGNRTIKFNDTRIVLTLGFSAFW